MAKSLKFLNIFQRLKNILEKCGAPHFFSNRQLEILSRSKETTAPGAFVQKKFFDNNVIAPGAVTLDQKAYIKNETSFSKSTWRILKQKI